MSTETPAVEPVAGFQSPPARKSLLPTLALTSLVLFATYSGLIAILLPNQIAMLGEEDKVANLAIVTTTSFIFTLFAQPIVGALSDRTRNRFGRRAPWMFIGAAVAAVFLVGLGSLSSVLWITIFWVIIQVSLNALQGPMTAIIPDRFPTEKRGAASAMMGLGMMLGGTVGVVVAANLAANVGIGYTAFGIAVLVVTLLFIVIGRDSSSTGVVVDAWSWKTFLSGFWINPVKHPDFFWAFTARFLFILGYFVVFAFQLYILTDYIKMPLAEANATMIPLSLAGTAATVVSILASGWWSDKIGRRKVFIYGATVFMAIGLSFPIFMPTVTGMLIMSIINGFGFGLYMAADTALMTEVLPGGGTAAGKDLGILNVATNIPQALSPAIAGLIIGVLGGYPVLFIFGIIAVVIAAVAIVPIKSVR